MKVMMTRSLGGLSILLALVAAPAARANPVAAEIVRVRQVPRTTHVQITYGWEQGFPAGTVTATRRDGAPRALTWTPYGGYTANTGSGLRSVSTTQACDCAVPLGSHGYEVYVKGPQGESMLAASLVVVDSGSDPHNAGPGGMDMWPWEIPEPSNIQGLDCAQACGLMPSDMGMGDGVGGCGCTLAHGGGIGAAIAAVALVLLAVALRGRRR